MSASSWMSAARPQASPYSPPWRDLATFVATFGGVGLLPKAPGTWGSLAALPIGCLILVPFGWQGILVASAVVTLIGWWASQIVVSRTGIKDHGARKEGIALIDVDPESKTFGKIMVNISLPPIWLAITSSITGT